MTAPTLDLAAILARYEDSRYSAEWLGARSHTDVPALVARVRELEAALRSIVKAGPSFPHRDIAARALGIEAEPDPRSMEQIRADRDAALGAR